MVACLARFWIWQLGFGVVRVLAAPFAKLAQSKLVGCVHGVLFDNVVPLLADTAGEVELLYLTLFCHIVLSLS